MIDPKPQTNDTRAEFPQDSCIHQLFEVQADRTPDAVALVWAEQQMTYAALNARANQLAHQLRALGVGPEVLVALCIERSLELVIGLLGILKAGGAYVPIAPDDPKDRIEFMLQDSAPQVLLTQRALLSRLPAYSAQTCCLDEADSFAAAQAENPTPLAASHNLVYVIYTSGSTGVPKGVLIEHRSLCNQVRSWIQLLALQPRLRMVQLAALSFDVSLLEIFSALSCGAELHLAPPQQQLSAEDLVRLLNARHIQVLDCTPSVLSLLSPESIPEVETITVGAEACTADLVARFAPGRRMFNAYGPTEATINVTLAELRPGTGNPSIGRPLPNNQVYILDAQLNPVPIGVPGELHIGGVGLARGYLNRPELTAQKFIPNPFSSIPGARLYKSGDLARFLPDGNIEFLGRIDHQVKLRGFRIELGEIESVLSAHDDVSAAVVLLREDAPGDKRLVAYVILKAGVSLNPQDLRAHLQHKLPDYMLPATFVSLLALPLTPHGKLDRKALPAPATERAAGSFVAPQSPMEQQLAELYAALLHIDRVGRNDDFFALGGHSLLATQLISRIRLTLGLDLPLRVLFTHPSVRALALHLASGSAQAAVQTPVVPAPRDQRIPLSFAQQRLWFLEQLEPGRPLYNIPLALHLRGPLDVQALCDAFTALVRRHDVLRTSFPARDGQPFQRIAQPPESVCVVQTLEPLAAESLESQTLRLVSLETLTPFSLSEGPLLRVRLLCLADTHHVLLLTMHHIISDGWSFGVLFSEVEALYSAFAKGVPCTLPPLAIQAADVALWERETLDAAALARQLSFWQAELHGLAPLELPTDHPRPKVFTYRGSTLSVAIPTSLTRALQRLTLEHGATLFMSLLATFATLLARYSGQCDIAIGSPIAHRTRTETESLIGFFVNTLVLRTRLDLDHSFLHLLAQEKEVCLQAFAHQDVPFDRLVGLLSPERDLSRTPLFQVMLVLQNAPMEELHLPAIQVEPIVVDNTTAQFDLTLSLQEAADGSLHGELEYCRDLWEPQTIERLWGHFLVLLQGVVDNPQAPLRQLPLLTESERHQILVAWNDTRAEYPQHLCIHQMFEAQAQRTPEAVALVFADQQLTYRNLDIRANLLAQKLRTLGVGPDVLVALCIERSLEMVIALLGILKAGGAYVPIDPDYPKDRIDFIVQDTSPAFILLQRTLADRASAWPASLVILEDLLSDPAPSYATLAEPAQPHHPAYVIYTSGSTGLPKGTLIAHRGLCNLIHHRRALYGVTCGTRVLQFASFSFDTAVSDIFLALCSGATLYIPEVQQIRDLAWLGSFIRTAEITFATLPPVVLAVLLDQPTPTLATLVVAGESCLPQLAATWLSRCRLVNEYGPTEATVCAAIAPCRQDLLPPVIGRPIANTQLYILDAQLSPVPIGVSGELHIGGVGLARGYLNRPELTAQKFIPHPFSSEPGARLYKSGDLARFLPDGNIEFLGRIDHQVKLRGFRIELGEIESVLSAHDDVSAAVVLLREDAPGDKRLVAYVILKAGVSLNPQDLRAHLQHKLPDYMLPAAFVSLLALPLTPHGKLDRKALPAPATERAAGSFVAPQSPMEQQLAELYAALLHIDRVGRNDDFFALGGDSILSLQLVARVAKAGYLLSVKQIFQHRTPALLAPLAIPSRVALAPTQVRTGPVPLTPIQHWLLDPRDAPAHHFNQDVLLQLHPGVQRDVLEQSLAAVHAHHEAFRLRFARTDAGPVQCLIEDSPRFFFQHVCVAEDLEAHERDARIEDLATKLHESFDLCAGPLSKLLWIDGAKDAPPLLLWVIHHLVVDGVSWRILLEDLAVAYVQLQAGQAAALPPVPVSFADWAERLQSFAHGASLLRQRGYWLGVLATPGHLPTDLPVRDLSDAAALYFTTTLDCAVTDLLTRAIAAACGANLAEALLTALALVLAPLIQGPSLRIDVESHGRDPDLGASLDLSRAIGWFTSLFPIGLSLRCASPLATLAQIKETLRNTPNSGIGFGALRYLARDPQLLATLDSQGEADLCFNYLGQLDADSAEPELFHRTALPSGPAHSPLRKRSHLVEIDALVLEGRLHITWIYSPSCHLPETVAAWVEALHQTLLVLLKECSQLGVGGYTPSDFPLCGLSQAGLGQALESLGLKGRRGVQDVYPLTAMQHGMLFHSLLAPDSAIYYEQLSLSLHGPLDPECMQAAWQHLIDQEPVLRTAFVFDVEPPVQVVLSDCTLPFARHDLSALGPNEATQCVAALAQARQRQGFSPGRAPLLCIDLVELSATKWQLIFGFHHALLDGWSLPRLLDRVDAAYLALRQGKTPPHAPGHSLRDFLEHLQGQDPQATESYFRKLLAGVQSPTPLPGRRPQTQTQRHADKHPASHCRRLSGTLSVQLQQLSRTASVTLNSLLQAAWALLLGRMAASDDVLFGATVSGRPPSLGDIESRLGLFINTMPVRVRLDPNHTVLCLAQTLQAQQLEARAFEGTALVHVQQLSELPPGQPLFESVLVFENYPLDPQGLGLWAGLKVEGVSGQEMTNYPLSVAVGPGEPMELLAEYDAAQFEPGSVERTLGILETLLEGIVENPHARLGELPLSTSSGAFVPRRR